MLILNRCKQANRRDRCGHAGLFNGMETSYSSSSNKHCASLLNM